jgi:cytochrome c5
MNGTVSRLLRAAPLAGALAAALVFGSLAAAPAGAQPFPEFPEPRFKQGRAVWLGTCEACHAHEVAGAPLVTRKAAWAPRGWRRDGMRCTAALCAASRGRREHRCRPAGATTGSATTRSGPLSIT